VAGFEIESGLISNVHELFFLDKAHSLPFDPTWAVGN